MSEWVHGLNIPQPRGTTALPPPAEEAGRHLHRSQVPIPVIASSVPTYRECANCEALCKRGCDENPRSKRCEFPHQTEGGRRKRIATLRDANNQGHHTRYVALDEFDLGDEWR